MFSWEMPLTACKLLGCARDIRVNQDGRLSSHMRNGHPRFILALSARWLPSFPKVLASAKMPACIIGVQSAFGPRVCHPNLISTSLTHPSSLLTLSGRLCNNTAVICQPRLQVWQRYCPLNRQAATGLLHSFISKSVLAEVKSLYSVNFGAEPWM